MPEEWIHPTFNHNFYLHIYYFFNTNLAESQLRIQPSLSHTMSNYSKLPKKYLFCVHWKSLLYSQCLVKIRRISWLFCWQICIFTFLNWVFNVQSILVYFTSILFHFFLRAQEVVGSNFRAHIEYVTVVILKASFELTVDLLMTTTYLALLNFGVYTVVLFFGFLFHPGHD